MKLTMIEKKGASVPAVLLANGELLDLSAASAAGLTGDSPLHSVMQIIDMENGLLAGVRALVDSINDGRDGLVERLTSLGALFQEATVTYTPLLRPNLIVACGRAYRAHNAEMGADQPPAPASFLKSPTSINSHRQPIILPRQSPDMVDFECEFSCVIGRTCHNVTPEEALDYIVGYTIANDISARRRVAEWNLSMRQGDPMDCVELQNLVILDKQFPGFCPLGPFVVTADEVGDPNDVVVETRLNGELMQHAHASDLVYPLAYSLSYFSHWYRFEPGDIMTTGSPAGVGYARNPQRFLKQGDILETSCGRIGILTNPVIDDFA